jgi:hypothetical protein
MYKPFRIALKSLWREFRRASTMYPSLFHERYYFCTAQAKDEFTFDPFDDKPVMANSFRDQPLCLAPEYWSAFIKVNKEGNNPMWDDSEWDRFEVFTDWRYCGRFFGNPSGLEEFKRLADSLCLVLCEFDSSISSWLNVSPKDEIRGYSGAGGFSDATKPYCGTLNILHEMVGYPTPLLWANHWRLSGVEFECPPNFVAGLSFASKPFPSDSTLYLVCTALVNNVFTSTMGAIQNILNPGNMLLVGDDFVLPRPSSSFFLAPKAVQQGSDVAVETKSDAQSTTALERVETPAFRFRLVGELWDVQYGEEKGHFRDLEGFRHIFKLLASPDKAIESMELQGLGDSPVANENMTPQRAVDRETASIVMNEIAKRELQIAEAKEEGNQAHASKLQKECIKLKEYLGEGRLRRLGAPSPRERSRKAVSNAIKRAKDKLKESMPGFVKFLDQSVLARNSSWIYTPLSPAPTWVL